MGQLVTKPQEQQQQQWKEEEVSSLQQDDDRKGTDDQVEARKELSILKNHHKDRTRAGFRRRILQPKNSFFLSRLFLSPLLFCQRLKAALYRLLLPLLLAAFLIGTPTKQIPKWETPKNQIQQH